MASPEKWRSIRSYKSGADAGDGEKFDSSAVRHLYGVYQHKRRSHSVVFRCAANKRTKCNYRLAYFYATRTLCESIDFSKHNHPHLPVKPEASRAKSITATATIKLERRSATIAAADNNNNKDDHNNSDGGSRRVMTAKVEREETTAATTSPTTITTPTTPLMLSTPTSLSSATSDGASWTPCWRRVLKKENNSRRDELDLLDGIADDSPVDLAKLGAVMHRLADHFALQFECAPDDDSIGVFRNAERNLALTVDDTYEDEFVRLSEYRNGWFRRSEKWSKAPGGVRGFVERLTTKCAQFFGKNPYNPYEFNQDNHNNNDGNDDISQNRGQTMMRKMVVKREPKEN